MNKFKNAVAKTHASIQENAVIMLAGAITGAAIGGYIVAYMAYKEGYSDALDSLIEDLTK